MSVRPAHRSRAAAGLASLLAVATLALAGCSDDPDTGTDGGDTTPQTIKVMITDQDVSPLGERVKVDAGEPVKIEITADHAGELHVHSTPEQSLAYEDGTVTRELTLDRPGVVEVESHDPDLVILQLQVG